MPTYRYKNPVIHMPIIYVGLVHDKICLLLYDR
jgi:hypothetical protein